MKLELVQRESQAQKKCLLSDISNLQC